MGPTQIKVLCVEDNPYVGDAIARKLDGNPEFAWLGCVDSSAALFAAVAETPPDVICMDLNIPGEDAFAMIEQLRTRSPSSRVMILTGHISQKLVEDARASGASGFLSKAEESRLIIQAIKKIAAGEQWFSKTDVSNRCCPHNPPVELQSAGKSEGNAVSHIAPSGEGGLLSFLRAFGKSRPNR